MFNHSLPVPRLYKQAAKISKDVYDGKGSIKQLLYQAKHKNLKGLYALIAHVFEHSVQLDLLLKKSQLLVKEPRLNEWLAKVLITELIWGKKRIAGESKPVKTVLAYEQILKAHLNDLTTSECHDTEDFEKPRYVRVNTLKISVDEAIEAFRDEGWVLKKFTERSNYQRFLEEVASLTREEFMVDIHVPSLLIFPPKTEFHQHAAYKSSKIMLQDKASCLPIHILNPEPGSVLLDMCAAPGMKTTQAAAAMEDKGKIYAIEIREKRFNTLKQIVEASGATCVKTIHADALTLTEREVPGIDYIIVDPSCSGSGITDRIEVGHLKRDQDPERIRKLAAFQITTLRYALKRFHAKRVVYSTCSVFPEENEDVVRQVLESCLRYKLVPAAPFIDSVWMNYGSRDFGDIGNFTLYTRPDIDLTGGFFVAVFERLEEGDVNPYLNRNFFPDVNKKTSNGIETTVKTKKNGVHTEPTGENVEKLAKKQQKKERKVNEEHAESTAEEIETQTATEEPEDTSGKKKKHKKKPEGIQKPVIPCEETKRKKRKTSKEVDDVKAEAIFELLNSTQDPESAEKSEKKKRKKRDTEEEASSSPDVEDCEAEIIKKEKKKRRADSDNVPESSERKHKKKKSKVEYKALMETPAVNSNGNEDFPAKKKKNKVA